MKRFLSENAKFRRFCIVTILFKKLHTYTCACEHIHICMYWRDIHLDYVIVEWETEGKTVREKIYVQISSFQ
jgi:hypothetical protein